MTMQRITNRAKYLGYNTRGFISQHRYKVDGSNLIVSIKPDGIDGLSGSYYIFEADEDWDPIKELEFNCAALDGSSGNYDHAKLIEGYLRSTTP